MQQSVMTHHMSSTTRTIFTDNELNNIVFLCLRYTFGGVIPELKNPSNKTIKELVFSVYEDPTPVNIIDKTLEFVVETYGAERLGPRLSGYQRHMRGLINEFIQQPSEIRNDLGDDRDSEDLITRH